MYDVDKLKERHYSIQLQLVFENELINIEERDIVEFSQKNDYLKQLLPVTTITFGVSNYLREKIQKNKSNVKLIVSITMDANTNYQKNIFAKTFIPMLEDEVINPYKEKNNEDKANKEEAKINTMTLYIFEEKSFNAVKKSFNLIFREERISNIALFILSQLELDFLVSPIDNNNTVQEVVIPNLNLKNAILYLQKVYGVFETGMRFYIGINRSYLLPKSLEKMPFEVNEPQIWNVYILGKLVDLRVPSGQYLDKDSNSLTLIGQQKLTYIENELITDNYIDGEKIVVKGNKDFNGITDIDKSNTIVKNDDIESVKNYYDPYDNEYNKNELEMDRISKKRIISMPVSNISILDITPNKKYNLIFEDELISYNGIYRLDGFNFSINKKESTNTFQMEGAIALTATE